MNDEDWLKHSNPLTWWTRFPAIPFLMAALWYRNWVMNCGQLKRKWYEPLQAIDKPEYIHERFSDLSCEW